SELTGRPYRLLSEAEYEYAARAETTTAFPWGAVIGNGNAQCGECDPPRAAPLGTAPVDSFPPNRFGLRDMVGNVFEWVEDCFHENYKDKGAPRDGKPWPAEGCTRRVIRGGAWLSRAAALRSAAREWAAAGDRKDSIGFRVARNLE